MGVMEDGVGERLFFAEGMIGGAFVAGVVFRIFVVPLLTPGGEEMEVSAVDAVLAGVVSEVWIGLVAVVAVAAVIATVMAGVNGAVGVGAAIVGGVAATDAPLIAVLILLAAWWAGYRGYRDRHMR